MKGKRLLACLAFTLVSLIGLLTTTAQADTGTTLSIDPSAVYLTVQPGTTDSGSLEVSNVGQSTFSYQSYVTPYSVENYVYSPVFVYVKGRPNAANWIKFSNGQGTILPNKNVELNYTITVPANVPPGGYYAVGFAETELPTTSPGIKVKERVGCVFYLQVAGAAKETGKVQSWNTPWLQLSPPKSKLQLSNSGSIDYISNITIKLQDILGSTKYTYQSQRVVLPQTIRDVNIRWPNHSFLAVLKITGTATVFGKSQPLPTKYVLVVSPTARFVLLVIVALLLVWSVLRYLLRRRLSNSKSKKYTVR